MRITIESTNSEPQYSRKVVIEKPFDDLSLEEIFELCANALEGFGYVGAKDFFIGDEQNE